MAEKYFKGVTILQEDAKSRMPNTAERSPFLPAILKTEKRGRPLRSTVTSWAKRHNWLFKQLFCPMLIPMLILLVGFSSDWPTPPQPNTTLTWTGPMGGKFPNTHLDGRADATKPPGAQSTQVLYRGTWRSKSLNNYLIMATLWTREIRIMASHFPS